MRDPKRIYKFCNRLAEIWLASCPDRRFAQLLHNVARGRDLFYMEEDELIRELESYFNIEHEE